MGARRKRSRNECLAAALGHPARRRIVREMSGGPPDSPRRLSLRLHQPLGSVSYHLRVLTECEVVESVGMQPAPEASERLYRVSIADEEMLSALERAALSNPPREEENG